MLNIQNRAEGLIHALLYATAAVAAETAPVPSSPRNFDGLGLGSDNFSSSSIGISLRRPTDRDSQFSIISTISHLSDPNDKGAIRTFRLQVAMEGTRMHEIDAEAKNQLKKISKTIQNHRNQIAHLKKVQQLEIEEFKKGAEKEYILFSTTQAEEREKLLAKQRKKNKSSKGKGGLRGSIKKLMDKTRKSIVDDNFFQSPGSTSTSPQSEKEENHQGSLTVPNHEESEEKVSHRMSGYMGLIEFDKSSVEKKRQLLMKQEAVYNVSLASHFSLLLLF